MKKPLTISTITTQVLRFRSLKSSYKQRKQPATQSFVTDVTENGFGPTKGDDTNFKPASNISLLLIVSSEQ